MLLLFFSNGSDPASAGNINAAAVIGNLWPPLNATGSPDAVFWRESEMYEWFNEAGRRLSGIGGVFVVRDTSLVSVASTPTYALPDTHQATIQADLAGKVLRPRNVQEIESLDSNWAATEDAPEAFLLDVEGAKKITLYPRPNAANAAKTIGLVMRSLPDEVSVSSGFLAAPPCLAEYFTFYILAEARAKETQAQMPEVSKWLRGNVSMMEQAIQGYLGGA